MSKITKSPQHGTTNDTPDTPESSSQADGTAADAPRGETQARVPRQTESAAQPSGPHSGNPATAAPVSSQSSENREGRINPSSPTHGTEIDHAVTRGSSLSDTFGEAGDPHGRGNLPIPEKTIESSKSQQENFVGNPPIEKRRSTKGASDLRRRREDKTA